MHQDKKINSIALYLLTIGVSFLLGMGVGYDSRPQVELATGINNKETPAALAQTDFAPFWTTWNLINEKYVNGKLGAEDNGTTTKKKMPTDQEKVYGAIQGLVSSLGDPYSVFMTPEQAESFQTEISGTFEGVGMELGIKKGVITVVAPLEGTPAKKA
ncbi:MAG TPA: hypothetical protein P5056_02585, partial [Candidatus Paceibacterota bacterium]|nr:hypothetical protein [Candidatus Paceibacterota bacterium]